MQDVLCNWTLWMTRCFLSGHMLHFPNSHVHLLSNSATRHNSRSTLTFVLVCLSVGRSPIWERSSGSTCPACRTSWGWFSLCASPGLSAQQEFSDLSPSSPCAASAWVIDSFRRRAGPLNESQNVAVVLNELSLLASHQWCSCEIYVTPITVLSINVFVRVPKTSRKPYLQPQHMRQ